MYFCPQMLIDVISWGCSYCFLGRVGVLGKAGGGMAVPAPCRLCVCEDFPYGETEGQRCDGPCPTVVQE